MESGTKKLTIVLNMFVQHFDPQNTANLRQRLEMVDVNDERPNRVVENRAKSLHVRSQLVGFDAEELVEKSMFVLANVDEECAGRPGQGAVIAFVFHAQVFDGVVDTGTHNQRALRKVELMQLRQQVLILRVLLVTILDEFDDSLDFRR